MVKAKELHDQSLEELEAQLNEAKHELFLLHNQRKQERKLEKPHLLRETKKDIAKILTVIRQKSEPMKSVDRRTR